MSNSLDDRKIAEGISYSFHLEGRATHKQVKALMKLRDIALEAGFYLKANHCGQIEARQIEMGSEGRKIATCMFI